MAVSRQDIEFLPCPVGNDGVSLKKKGCWFIKYDKGRVWPHVCCPHCGTETPACSVPVLGKDSTHKDELDVVGSDGVVPHAVVCGSCRWFGYINLKGWVG